MSLNPETITQIQTMLQADPALLAQLQAETELAGVAAVLVNAAAAQGLDVSEADLISHPLARQPQVCIRARSDAELEQVAGGVRHIRSMSSFMTLSTVAGGFCGVGATPSDNSRGCRWV